MAVIKLIEAQKNLNSITISNSVTARNAPFYENFEKALIKHADTVQHLKIDWNPVTKILSHLVNLVSLDIDVTFGPNWGNFKNVENISLPVIKDLRARDIPFKI